MNKNQFAKIAAWFCFWLLVGILAHGATTNRLDAIRTHLIVWDDGDQTNKPGAGGTSQTNGLPERIDAQSVTGAVSTARGLANSVTGAVNAARSLANSVTGSVNGASITANSLTGSLNTARSLANSATGALAQTAGQVASIVSGATNNIITNVFTSMTVSNAGVNWCTNAHNGIVYCGIGTNQTGGSSGGFYDWSQSNTYWVGYNVFTNQLALGPGGYGSGGLYLSNVNMTADTLYINDFGGGPITNLVNLWFIDQSTNSILTGRPAVSFAFGFSAFALPTPNGNDGSYAIGPGAQATGPETFVINLTTKFVTPYSNHGTSQTLSVNAPEGTWIDGGLVTITNTLVASNNLYVGNSLFGQGVTNSVSQIISNTLNTAAYSNAAAFYPAGNPLAFVDKTVTNGLGGGGSGFTSVLSIGSGTSIVAGTSSTTITNKDLLPGNNTTFTVTSSNITINSTATGGTGGDVFAASNTTFTGTNTINNPMLGAGASGLTNNLILATNLTAVAQSISVYNIPATYNHLECIFSGGNTGVYAYAFLTFNGDAGANYDDQWLRCNGTSAGGFADTGATSLRVGSIQPRASTRVSNLRWTVLNYCAVSLDGRGVESKWGNMNTEAGMAWGEWRSTAAITSMTFSATGIHSNSMLYIYGK